MNIDFENIRFFKPDRVIANIKKEAKISPEINILIEKIEGDLTKNVITQLKEMLPEYQTQVKNAQIIVEKIDKELDINRDQIRVLQKKISEMVKPSQVSQKSLAYANPMGEMLSGENFSLISYDLKAKSTLEIEIEKLKKTFDKKVIEANISKHELKKAKENLLATQVLIKTLQ